MDFYEISFYKIVVRRGAHLRQFWSAGGNGFDWWRRGASLFEGSQWWWYPVILWPR
jgi:hypothetical protein